MATVKKAVSKKAPAPMSTEPKRKFYTGLNFHTKTQKGLAGLLYRKIIPN